MCPGGKVGIESSYLPPRPELFDIRSHGFDTVKLSSTCFLKKQGSTYADCNPKPGQHFVNACHLGMGWGTESAKESSNGSLLFLKPRAGGKI